MMQAGHSYSTGEVLELLRRANPQATITGARLRHALCYGKVPTPVIRSGRYCWTPEEIRRLARALGLRIPRSRGRRDPLGGTSSVPDATAASAARNTANDEALDANRGGRR